MPSPPVAVLTNRSTASSGEAIVVAFRGRPNTRSFGEGTRGVSTSNRSFALNDGAMLLLTVAIFADRTGQKYGDVIVPDEVVDTPSSESDRVLDTAVKWLCQSSVNTASVRRRFMRRTSAAKSQKMTRGCWTLASGLVCIEPGLPVRLSTATKFNDCNHERQVWLG